MSFKTFTVPIQDAGAAEAELNGFLRSHKILSVEQRWVEQGAYSFWSFCVDYMEGMPGNVTRPPMGGARAKVDYKEILKPEEFSIYLRLRELRKEIAQAQAVPVYTIFTNEQLAKMVQAKATTKAALEEIAGVGDARIEKYGARVLALLTQVWKNGDEAGRFSV
jgi:superfamily II DNA helicase RecQ